MGNSLISRVDLATNGRIHEFQSLEPRKSINLESPKRNSPKKKRISTNIKNSKFNFKTETFNENSYINEKPDIPFSKKKRASAFDKRKKRRISEQKRSTILCSEISNKITPLKKTKTVKKGFLGIEKDINKKRHLSESKSRLKERDSKGSLVVPKSEQNINIEVEKNGIRNSRDYFAKEKKEDCKIQ